MPYSVSQLATYLDVSTNTIRNWGDDFAEHLSAGANPPKNRPRMYTEEDVAVMETVAVLRAQHVPLEEIAQRLAAGDRLEFDERSVSLEKESKEAAEGDPGETAALVTESFARALQAYDSQVARLQERIEELHAKRLEAEKRATAAETELRLLRERMEEEKDAGAEEEAGGEDESRPWWRFWE